MRVSGTYEYRPPPLGADTREGLLTWRSSRRLVAVTPSKSKEMPFDQVRKICYDNMVTGMETISPIASRPFRFIYVSGSNAERDQTKKPWILGDYSLMRVRP